MTALISKPGITSVSTLSIPKTWDATWFRNFIQNQLKGADVRNAVGVNGISVTGNIASPYAQIGLVGPVTIRGPGTLPGPALALVISTADGYAITLSDGVNTQAFIGFGGITLEDLQIGCLGANGITFMTSSINRVEISANGTVTVKAPSSGIALTVNGAAAAQIGIFNGSGANTWFDY